MSPGGDVAEIHVKEFVKIYTQRPHWETLLRRNYEVHVNGAPVDPVYFFSNDLNPAEFDRMLKIAATGSAKSFD